MTERNNYCKKKTAEYTDFKLEIIRARIGSFESESQARLGTLGKRVALSSWGIGKRVARSSWGVPKQPTARSSDTLPRS